MFHDPILPATKVLCFFLNTIFLYNYWQKIHNVRFDTDAMESELSL